MRKPTVRELYTITTLCIYGATVMFIVGLPWEKAITGLACISAVTPIAVILLLFKK